jgi:hypothetical protein
VIRFALFSLALAVPAAAQDLSTVEFMARKLNDDDAGKVYASAIAACLAGQGDAEKTAALFTGKDWTLTEEAEMGLNELASPHDAVYVLAATDGSFCAAYAEDRGTDVATANLMVLIGAGGLGSEDVSTADGCFAFQLTPTIVAEVTSSGNDPVCQDDATSSVRFTFAPAT